LIAWDPSGLLVESTAKGPYDRDLQNLVLWQLAGSNFFI
jgi:hypothetical protein